MAVVEGPFRYVVAAEGGEDACGVPLAFPRPPGNFSIRYAKGLRLSAEESLTVSLTQHFLTDPPRLVARSSSPPPVSGLAGIEFSTVSLPAFSVDYDWLDGRVRGCFARGHITLTGESVSIDPRALSLDDLPGSCIYPGTPPYPPAPVTSVLKIADMYGAEAPSMVKLVPPEGNEYLLDLDGRQVMAMEDAVRLEAAQVKVELAPGVVRIPNTPELELEVGEPRYSSVNVKVKKNGSGLTTHPDWLGLLEDYLHAPRLAGAGCLSVQFLAWGSAGGSQYYTDFAINLDFVQAAVPIAGVSLKRSGPPKIWCSPDLTVTNYTERYWRFELNRNRLFLTENRMEVRAINSVLQIIATLRDGTRELLATLDFTHHRGNLELDVQYDRYDNLEPIRGHQYRPDFGNTVLVAQFATPESSDALSNKLIPWVRT